MHVEKAELKLGTKLQYSWEPETRLLEGTNRAAPCFPTWNRSHWSAVLELCFGLLHFTRKGKSVYVFEGQVIFPPFGCWHLSWKIAFTISVFTLTDGNLSDVSFPAIDTCCAFKNLHQLLWMSYLGGFMLTDTKYVICHTDPQGFP